MSICSLSTPLQCTTFVVLFYTTRQISDTKWRPSVTRLNRHCGTSSVSASFAVSERQLLLQRCVACCGDICQGQMKPAHLTTPIGRPKHKFCSAFCTVTPIIVAKVNGAQEAPNALYPEDSKLQPGPLLLISGERVEFNPHFPTPSTRSSTTAS